MKEQIKAAGKTSGKGLLLALLIKLLDFGQAQVEQYQADNPEIAASAAQWEERLASWEAEAARSESRIIQAIETRPTVPAGPSQWEMIGGLTLSPTSRVSRVSQ